MANLHLVTGYAGQSHIKSADHGSLNAAIVGNGNYVLNRGNKFSASAITSNTVRVLDGDLLLQGRHVRLESYVDLTITSGTQSMKRHDLIVARYTKNNSTCVEECNLVVIKGTAATSPKDPAYTDGDILAGSDTQADFPLYRVELNGVNIAAVTQLFDTVELVKVGADGKINSSLLPLSSSINSTSETTPANSYAVKQAYDKAVAVQTNLSTTATIANQAFSKATAASRFSGKSGTYGDAFCDFIREGRIAWVTVTPDNGDVGDTGVELDITLPWASAWSGYMAASIRCGKSDWARVYVTLIEGETNAKINIGKELSSEEEVIITFTYVTTE